MSMIGLFRRLSGDDLARLIEEPDLVENYIVAEEPPEGFGPFAELDIDKAWHAIHFLLTGTAWEGEHPWNFVATGGTEIGDDLGYGPARALRVAEVREIASALEGLPAKELSIRFDPKAMADAEVYPDIWDRAQEQDDTRGYVIEYYDALREFVIGAAAGGEAMIVYLS